MEAVRASITIVRPGQILVVRVDPRVCYPDDFYHQLLEQVGEASLVTGIRMVVIACDQLAVAEADPALVLAHDHTTQEEDTDGEHGNRHGDR